MTHQQILETAVQKAIDGGYKHKYISVHNLDDDDILIWQYQLGFPATNLDNQVFYGPCMNIERLLFNHDFAKSLWSEEMIETHPLAGFYDYSVTKYTPAWVLHLQQMVIADDPIEYLGENL